MKKGKTALFSFGIFILFLILIINVSAGVYFSQPAGVYNLGDAIEIGVDITPLENAPVKIELICNGNPVIVYFSTTPEESFSFAVPLTSAYIKDISGDCYFEAEYSKADYKSRSFKISSELEISLDIDSIFAKPGEEILISGNARRLNGIGINGTVEITIPVLNLIQQIISTVVEANNETSNETAGNESKETAKTNNAASSQSNAGNYIGIVSDGRFSLSFNLSKDIPAGDYRIDVLAYELSNNEKTSKGNAAANLKVQQVLTNIDIALNSQSLNPGDSFSFKPLLLDQSELPIYDEVSVIIRDEKQNRIFERIMKSGETIEYKIPTNLTSGYYEAEVSKAELSSIKKFYVNEKAIADFKIENDSLTVINIGNILYNKDVQIDLNGKPFVKKLNLALGEQAKFKLTGSNEAYDIKVSDGESETTASGIVLTGYAVNVKEIAKGSGIFLSPVIWIFLLVILGAGVLFLFRNIFKKSSFAYPWKEKLFGRKNQVIRVDENGKIIKDDTKPKQKEIIKKFAEPPSQAEQSLVLDGYKTKAAVVALKIKNKIEKNSKQSLEKAIEQVYEKKGAVYEQGDYILIVFSSIVTHSFKNEIEAVKIAQKISSVLREHNRKFKEKIEFGIGINSGDIINKIEDKKLKFTALGNTIGIVKKLADMSKGEILVSKLAYEAGITSIKAEKKIVNNNEIYEVKEIVDKEKNEKFINEFLGRIGKEEIQKKSTDAKRN